MLGHTILEVQYGKMTHACMARDSHVSKCAHRTTRYNHAANAQHRWWPTIEVMGEGQCGHFRQCEVWETSYVECHVIG